MRDFDKCPNCGAELPPKALVCLECGSDEKTGWSDSAHADRLGIPDESFDYDEFVANEFGTEKKQTSGKSRMRWVIAAVLLGIFLFAVLRR